MQQDVNSPVSILSIQMQQHTLSPPKFHIGTEFPGIKYI